MTRDSTTSDTILERLRRVGLRPTRQRISLADLLFSSGDRHLTAEQLHSEAMASNVQVSLATVYNALHQFTDAGLLREVVVEAGRSYFDTNTTDHHHFFLVEHSELRDIQGGRLLIHGLPDTPEGCAIERVDVIVRVRSGQNKQHR